MNDKMKKKKCNMTRTPKIVSEYDQENMKSNMLDRSLRYPLHHTD